MAQARGMEQRLLGFLQNECGHQHPLLRHLAKVLHNDNDDAGAFRAVGIPLVAAEHLGLPTDEGGRHLLGPSDAVIQRG